MENIDQAKNKLEAVLREMCGHEFDDPHLDADGIIGARRLARGWSDSIEIALKDPATVFAILRDFHNDHYSVFPRDELTERLCHAFHDEFVEETPPSQPAAPMKDEIVVRPSPSADTRSADHAITEDELRKSTEMHILDVAHAMAWLARRLLEIGQRHDWTKVDFFDDFYRQFHKAQETGEWGVGWYDEIHIVKERHHLERCPEDVTLLDVLEQIVDCVCAGKARTGKFEPRPLDEEILSRAYLNTQRMLADAVRVEG